jgi:hypothetical protein
MAKETATLAYKAYSVSKREGQDDWWTECGGVFAHADGQGFTVLLQCLPLDGRIVLRLPKAETNDRDNNRDERDTRSRHPPRQRSDKR